MQGSVFTTVGGTRYIQQKYKTRLQKALTFFLHTACKFK